MPKRKSHDLTIYQWDALAEAYIDIIWSLQGQLPTKTNVPTGAEVQGEFNDPLSHDSTTKEIIESEMHRLFAHFLKTIFEGVFTKTRIDSEVYVLCSKKYGSPCHPLTMLFSLYNVSIRVGDAVRVMLGSGLKGHELDSGWVTHRYLDAVNKAPRIRDCYTNLTFLTVILEAARWTWFQNPQTRLDGIKILHEADESAYRTLQSRERAKFDEIMEELESFKTTGELLKISLPPGSRHPTRVFLATP